MEIDIVWLASIISSLGIIFGFIIGAYKYIEKVNNLKRENAALREENKQIKKELGVICDALDACLDGLEQLGANHTVPKARMKLKKHLNKAAHDEE